MELLDRIEKQAKKAAEKVQFVLEYIPGEIEELDQYRASHEKMEIYCYGDTEDQALESAKNEAFAYFMKHSSKINQQKIK